MSEEELVTAGTVSDKVDDEKAALEKKQKNKMKRWLLEETEKANRRGVCYLSRVPPHMDPKKLRQTLSQYGELERVYLTPEDAESLVRRKKSGVFRGKEFSEGWVEFTDKRVAKRVASMLNGEQIGGRKRSSFYYDLWNIKYLSKFKWDDLTEEIAYKSATQEQKLALELSAAKREFDFYLHKSDQSTAINKMAERLKKKLSKGGSSKGGGAEDKSRGKKNAKDILSVPVDQYSGRLREIRGREKGPMHALARARRSKLMANEELSSDDTENLIEDSYESPETIDSQTRNRLESEIPLQQGADDFQDDTSCEADNNFNTNSYRPSTHFNHPNSYRASPHLNDDVPPFNVSGYSQMSDHTEGEGGSGQRGKEAPNNATNQPWRELTQGIDGGPTNAELLTGFLGHIAHSIWMGNVSHLIPYL